ncbi:MAG: hypothetical protein IKJ28_02720, partial [Alphaproteobacteria bacterium]|nr:hypothetical protein [Alphaproteobacteria bacterium]
EWKNDSCQCPALTPYYDGEKCITCTEATDGTQPYFDNGVCVGGRFCLSFDATADKNACMMCDDTTGQLLEKPNGEVCTVRGLEGTCTNGECFIPCDTQDDCGGAHSDFYCHYEFNDRVTDITCLNPLKEGRKRYCVSKERATRSISSMATETIKNYKISKETMNWFDAQNFCKAWGMRLPIDKDFGCTYSYLGHCKTASIVELNKAYSNDPFWLNQSWQCRHLGIRLGNGQMNRTMYGVPGCLALCITDNSIEKGENICLSSVSSDCQICNPETQEITFLPNGDECSLDTGGKGLCQNGVCILAGQGCNENTDCNVGEYCRYIALDTSTYEPLVNEETGFKGVCRIVHTRQKLSDRPVETANEALDWYSANNFCKALGLKQIKSNFCGVKGESRYCSNVYFSNFEANFGKQLTFWCGPYSQVGFASFVGVSLSAWPDSSFYPYCY